MPPSVAATAPRRVRQRTPAGGTLAVVNFHYVRPAFDAPYDGIHGVTPAALATQLEALGALGDFVTLGAVHAALGGGRPLPPRAVLVTFDDGLREQVEHALPVLDRLRVPAAFFVSTAPIADGTPCAVHLLHALRARVAPGTLLDLLRERAPAHGAALAAEVDAAAAAAQYRYDTPEAARLKYLLNFTLDHARRDALVLDCFARACGDPRDAAVALYMTRDDVRAVAVRGALGTHGHRHVPLATLSAADRCREVARSIGLLHSWTGSRPFAISYPYGSRHACGPEVADAAAACGLALGFSMERARNVGLTRPLLLARFDANDLPGGRDWHAGRVADAEALPDATWFAAGGARVATARV